MGNEWYLEGGFESGKATWHCKFAERNDVIRLVRSIRKSNPEQILRLMAPRNLTYIDWLDLNALGVERL